jgi:hypothetical protein
VTGQPGSTRVDPTGSHPIELTRDPPRAGPVSKNSGPDPDPFGVGPGRPSGQPGLARPLDSLSASANSGVVVIISFDDMKSIMNG